MGDIQFTEMVVDEIKSDNGRTIITAGGQMYSFFQTKKDGQPSRAQTDFETLGVTIGQNYSFGITENVKQMPDGKSITFRNIVLISASRGGQQQAAVPQSPAPQSTTPQQAPPTQENIPDPTPPTDIPAF
jgi:hypothetical protein